MPLNVSNSIYIPEHSRYRNKKEFTGELDPDAFLKLLIEQLRYQDPLSPMDNQQFMQQTMMMSMVERLTSMEAMMEETNSNLLNLSKYEGLIGKTASYEVINPDTYTREVKKDVISAVWMDQGKFYFRIGNDTVARANIIGLESIGMTNDSLLDNTLKYSQFLGKNITYAVKVEVDVDGKKTTIEEMRTGVINGFSVKDNQVEFVLDNGSKISLADIRGVEHIPDNIPVDNTLRYAQLIGYKINYTETVTDEEGNENETEKTGTITAISMKNGIVELVIDDGTKVKLSQITGFEAGQ